MQLHPELVEILMLVLFVAMVLTGVDLALYLFQLLRD
jgi:hypothetical protein